MVSGEDTASLVITALSLILNTVQFLFLAYLRAKFTDYPTHPSGVVIIKDEDGRPEVTDPNSPTT